MRFLLFLFIPFLLNSQTNFSHQDSLRGTLNSNRTWWDVKKYEITVQPDFETKTIQGKNEILIEILTLESQSYLQLDLHRSLSVDSIYSIYSGSSQRMSFTRDNNIILIDFSKIDSRIVFTEEAFFKLIVYYSGKPKEAVKAPWDGGWIFTKDEKGRPWMTVACQGLGASVWFPCKDHQSDEPDYGATITVIASDTLEAVSNGELKELRKVDSTNLKSTTWAVNNPINNYNIVPYIGKYVNFNEVYNGEKGFLNCNYWVIDYELEKAKLQFKDVPKMLKCFEYWFGPYPFYEDGYKIVQAPYLGMEHQSAIAYGNKFQNGYLGKSLSESDYGMKWDFILVHESGHEWFGNSITSKDIADMWIHESFTNYSETIFTDCMFGVEAGNKYEIGLRHLIKNDKPVIGEYGVNNEGSGDMYYKGSNMIHIIRQLVNDDERFRQMLRGLNKRFYHKTVTTQEIEQYILKFTGLDLSKVFDQYLRTTQVPVLEYKIENNQLYYHWTDCVQGFELKIRLENGNWVFPSENWKILDQSFNKIEDFKPDANFLIKLRKII
jgi:aminopeptidase N